MYFPLILLALFCISSTLGAGSTKTVRICDGKSVTLKCAPGSKLNLVNAYYGRKSHDVCPTKGAKLSKQNCSYKSSRDQLKAHCNNKNTCKVTASSKKLKASCGGTRNYVAVQYECIKGQKRG